MGTVATIEDAKTLLTEVCAEREGRDSAIMQGAEGERLHALDVLSWVERLNPKASLSLRLAALFHDIDRVVNPEMGGGFRGDRNSEAYMEHKKRHARRSASFTVSQLAQRGFHSQTVSRAEFLILHHDDSGSEVGRYRDEELDTLVTADTFGFFTSIAPKLFAVEGFERLRDKIRFMISKIPEPSRAALWENHLENETFESLKNEVLREYYLKHGYRESRYQYCPSCKNALKRKLIDGQALLACEMCGFVFWNPPHPVTSVIVESESKVLLIRRALTPLRGYWCLPGGYVRYAEAPEAAASREVKEETGLDVLPSRLIGVYQIDNDPRGVNLDIIFTGTLVGGSLAVNEESSEACYFSYEDLPSLIAYKHRQALFDSRRKGP